MAHFSERKDAKTKQPYFISRTDGKLMALAGLWERKTLDGGETLHSFTVATTDANAFMGKVHERMPVILSQETAGALLGETATEPEAAAALMRPRRRTGSSWSRSIRA